MIWAVLFIALWGLPLAGVIWGWVRWARAKTPRSVFSLLSFTGIGLATGSVLLEFLPLIRGGLDTARFLGFWTALLGIVFAICGAWRPSPLRWHAAFCSVAMCTIWVLSVVCE